jgi:hypothetical protein
VPALSIAGQTALLVDLHVKLTRDLHPILTHPGRQFMWLRKKDFGLLLGWQPVVSVHILFFLAVIGVVRFRKQLQHDD